MSKTLDGVTIFSVEPNIQEAIPVKTFAGRPLGVEVLSARLSEEILRRQEGELKEALKDAPPNCNWVPLPNGWLVWAQGDNGSATSLTFVPHW